MVDSLAAGMLFGVAVALGIRAVWDVWESRGLREQGCDHDRPWTERHGLPARPKPAIEVAALNHLHYGPAADCIRGGRERTCTCAPCMERYEQKHAKRRRQWRQWLQEGGDVSGLACHQRYELMRGRLYQ